MMFVNFQLLSNILDSNKAAKKLKSDSLVMKFQSINEENVKLLVYSDSSFGNLPDGSSQGGYIILLADDKGHFSLLTWQSIKIRRIARSTIAAESLALMDGADSSLFLLCEIMHGSSKESLLPVDCIIDNCSLFVAIHSTKGIAIEKRLRIDIGVIREMLKKSEISSVKRVEKKYQLADCLTKKGASTSNFLQVFSKGKLPQ